MSVDIYFQKRITLEDVANKTSIKVEFVDNRWWLVKGEKSVLAECDYYTQDDIDRFKSAGLLIEEVNGEYYFIDSDGIKGLLPTDKGIKNTIAYITSYGVGNLSAIMPELVVTFQNKFITCNEWEHIMHCKHDGKEVDENKYFDEKLLEYDFQIDENGIISLKNNK